MFFFFLSILSSRTRIGYRAVEEKTSGNNVIGPVMCELGERTRAVATSACTAIAHSQVLRCNVSRDDSYIFMLLSFHYYNSC